MRDILVCVVGTTPQVVTETLYALALRNPPIHPQEIWAVTTAAGRRGLEKSLLEQGMLKRFCKDYGAPVPEMGGDRLVVIKDAAGREIEDVVSEADSEAAGDRITALVRDLSEDKNVRLHCSIAGGRKTMSFYLGAALQLFGRPSDKLYHVLVSPEFESLPEFFYKPKKNRLIEKRSPDGSVKRLNTRDANIILAELPFIRLRDKLSLEGRTFRDLVAEGQREIDTTLRMPELRVELTRRRVRVGNKEVHLTPTQLVVYASLLRRKKEACTKGEQLQCLDCTDCFWVPGKGGLGQDDLRRLARECATVYCKQPYKTDEFLKVWKEKGNADLVRQHVSKINRAFKEGIGEPTLWPYYTVTSLRRYGGTGYGVQAERGRITIID